MRSAVSHLPREAPSEHVLHGELGPDELERDRLPVRAGRLVDAGHPTLAEAHSTV